MLNEHKEKQNLQKRREPKAVKAGPLSCVAWELSTLDAALLPGAKSVGQVSVGQIQCTHFGGFI